MQAQPNSLQDYLIAEILRHFPKRSDAIDAIAILFGTSRDPIYRRFRGTSVFTPEELQVLATHFNISLDAYIFKNTNTVVFSFNPFTQVVKKFEDYLESIYADSVVLKGLPNLEIWYASAEIPIFYYIIYPEIFSFKLYVWGRTIWNFSYLENKPFDLDIIPRPAMQKAEEVMRIYNQLPATELWSLNIMDNTLNQIEYHFNSSGFKNPQDAVLLCDKMIALTEHMQIMGAYGKKVPLGALNNAETVGGAFNLYHNEMIYTNNTIYVRSERGRAVYTTHGNPNFLKTTDERMCDYTENWFKSVISKSAPLSAQSEKGRRWFFDKIRRRIEVVKNRIEQQLNNAD
jgi:hypothetical protein